MRAYESGVFEGAESRELGSVVVTVADMEDRNDAMDSSVSTSVAFVRA